MLIAISGKAGSGKTAAAQHLRDNYGFTVRSFAYPLKEACRIIFSFSETQLYGTQEQKLEIDPRWGCSARRCLQYVGTDLLRDQMETIMPCIGEDIWIRSFQEWYSNQPPGTNVVIDDVRFQNEVDAIHKMGGLVISISLPDCGSVESTTLHSSEKMDLVGCDMYVINNKNVDFFHNFDLAVVLYHKR